LAAAIGWTCRGRGGDLPEGFDVLGVDDSKKLTEKKREALFDQIIGSAVAYGVGIVDNYVIDRFNILQATRLAMKRALGSAGAQARLHTDRRAHTERYCYPAEGHN
jgi:ribonuclease HII